MKAKLINPNGSMVEVSPANGEKFTYEELLKLVDCEFLEYIAPPSTTGAVMIIDEEGKLNNKPVNQLATAMWQEGSDPGSMRMDDPVVGMALLCHRSQLDLE